MFVTYTYFMVAPPLNYAPRFVTVFTYLTLFVQ